MTIPQFAKLFDLVIKYAAALKKDDQPLNLNDETEMESTPQILPTQNSWKPKLHHFCTFGRIHPTRLFAQATQKTNKKGSHKGCPYLSTRLLVYFF